jgi:Putative addiction module component
MSVPILPLNEMSVEEKLQTMETLWQSLSADPAAVESPAWHEEELAERERRIASGRLSSSSGKRRKLIFGVVLREDRDPAGGAG